MKSFRFDPPIAAVAESLGAGDRRVEDAARAMARRDEALEDYIARMDRFAAARHFDAALSNGTATSAAAFISHTGLFTADEPFVMSVSCLGRCGFSTADNRLTLRVRDEGGADITLGPPQLALDNQAGRWSACALMGRKEYAPGQSAGFSLAYSVSAANAYIDLGVEVRFAPLP